MSSFAERVGAGHKLQVLGQRYKRRNANLDR
jgi:hypothetical protein